MSRKILAGRFGWGTIEPLQIAVVGLIDCMSGCGRLTVKILAGKFGCGKIEPLLKAGVGLID
jgi:hypothetical protein